MGVRICKGNYKGLAGIVTNATTTHVTVELHTRNRSVTQPRECIKIVAGTWWGTRACRPASNCRTGGLQHRSCIDAFPYTSHAITWRGHASVWCRDTTPHHTLSKHCNSNLGYPRI